MMTIVVKQRKRVYNLRHITVIAWRRRFTESERVSIIDSNDPKVRLLYDDLQTIPFVNLDSESIKDAVDYMISIGVVDSTRKEALLSDGTRTEIYKNKHLS